jgi:hypothetical protein
MVPGSLIRDRQIIVSETLLIPDGETATLPISYGDWTVNIVFHVKPDELKDGKHAIKWETDADPQTIKITYYGMPPRTAVTNAPAQLFVAGPNDSQRAMFLSAYYRAGYLNVIHFQLMLETQR